MHKPTKFFLNASLIALLLAVILFGLAILISGIQKAYAHGKHYEDVECLVMYVKEIPPKMMVFGCDNNNNGLIDRTLILVWTVGEEHSRAHVIGDYPNCKGYNAALKEMKISNYFNIQLWRCE